MENECRDNQSPLSFEEEIRAIINRRCLESISNTPDFILAEYLVRCLQTFDYFVNMREEYYGKGRRDRTETRLPVFPPVT